MTQSIDSIRAHYDRPGLIERIKTALGSVEVEKLPLSVAQLASLDQFHTRGIFATADLASAVGLKAEDAVLDLGCGVGGPARYLAATFGCGVTGVDLSPSFVEAADYLTQLCGLTDLVTFQVGEALHLPFKDGAFDCVFLQHVVMNIADRPTLYAEVRRVLKPEGRLATYDLVLTEGEVIYPTPWARDASASFLLSAGDTLAALEAAGFAVTLWRDDTRTALDWLKASATNPPSPGMNLGAVMGAEFPTMAVNLGRNVREGRLGVLLAVLARN